MPLVRVFVGASLDGFIAGPNDELDWLGAGDAASDREVQAAFTSFLAEIGCVLMGRRTYEIACGFAGPWPYGTMPMLIATRRPLPAERAHVTASSGSIEELVARAKQSAGERDVYIDGGQLIRSALDAELVDQITVTIVPVILGAGIPLFAGAAKRHRLRYVTQQLIGGAAVSLRYALQRDRV
jgi:dihydrofolate reductase